jgi:hypothetical protein
MIKHLKGLNKFLKTNYGGPEYKSLRRNIWSSFIFMIFMGIYSWITAIFVWWYAVLRRYAVANTVYHAIYPELPLYIRIKLNPLVFKRRMRIIEMGLSTRLGAAERIKTQQDAVNHVGWKITGNAWRYEKDAFTLQEQEIIALIAYEKSFDWIRDTLKKKLSFTKYHLLLHLSIDNISNPYPQKFMLEKYNNKWWKACIADYVFRNPRNTGYQIGRRFTTCDLTNVKIKGMKYAYGKVEIEGIWERELGYQFYFTPDMKYFHFQMSNQAMNQGNVLVPKDTSWFQFGYGYLKPTSSGDRPYLGTSLRQIKNQITYYETPIKERFD